MLCDAFFAFVTIFIACLLRSQIISFDVTSRSIFSNGSNPFRIIFASVQVDKGTGLSKQ